ncbi:hypothetical protein KY343_03730 [Candidatus Woesearchaeota archaeon]|nr:hypothetical protein [Candidatus Woesearchaeota archaeon]
MDEDNVRRFKGIKVKIFLNNHRMYTGFILSVKDGTAIIKDKYDLEIPISCSMIGLIEPCREAEDEG